MIGDKKIESQERENEAIGGSFSRKRKQRDLF
jgi:hypothetical protein